jgi:RTA1 like protein
MGGAILLLNKTGDPQRQQTGQNTLMAGLAINLGSFCFFFTLIIWYEVATRRIARGLSSGLSNTSSNGLHDTYSRHPSPGRLDNFLSRLSANRTYAPIVWATMVSQIFLIWRSIYRVIEFQQGYFSPIATTEIYFYFFDTLIMLLATAIYVFLFPPAFGLLGKRRLVLKLEEEGVEMGRRERGEGEIGVKGEVVG